MISDLCDLNRMILVLTVFSACDNGHSARAVREYDYLARWLCELAAKIVRFNAFERFSLKLS